VLPPWLAHGLLILLHVGLCGVFGFGFLRGLGLRRPAAALGGLAFMLAAS